MSRLRYLIACLIIIMGVALSLGMVDGKHSVTAQAQPQALRVEAAVTGTLSSNAPSALFTFNAVESLRMSVVFDVVGDMQPTLTVYDQDEQSVLAQSSGTGNNGVVVNFPSTGQYYLELVATAGSSATYRLMIDADPSLPINPFVVQSYLVRGTSSLCSETVPTASFTPNEDLNVCFVMDLLEGPTDVKIEWWSPSGTLVTEETGTFDPSYNLSPVLSGIVFANTPFEAGWWQAHILINGELSHIQWVSVN